MKGGAFDFLVKGKIDASLLERSIRYAMERYAVEEMLRQREAQLVQAEKMEAVGKLAGGIAHEFNNLMTVIIGQSRLLLADMEDPKTCTGLEDILKAGGRAASLTRQLLAFSQKQMLRPKALDLSDLLSETVKMLVQIIEENIELITVFRSQEQVKADPGQLEQVVLYLSANARDAMPGGGQLRIETADVDLDEAFTERFEEVRPGRFVMILVSDTGVGMDEKTVERIYEPFFSTKAAGESTGMGLSTVYGIVVQSGGCIDVETGLEKGTTFRVYLPRIDDEEDDCRGPETSGK